jgi:hypothetical protein
MVVQWDLYEMYLALLQVSVLIVYNWSIKKLKSRSVNVYSFIFLNRLLCIT